MSVTTTNLIQGAGDLYAADFGATEPADTAFADAPGDPFVDCGGTDGGVNLIVKQEYAELGVDQLVDTPERRLTKREFMVETNLAEVTVENLTLALNGNVASTTSGSGGTANTALTAGSSSPGGTGPDYSALIFDGYGASAKRRRFIGRKMLQTGDVGQAYAKDKQTFLPVSFVGHFVSAAILPFKIVQDTSA